jgi:hypothetical protein
VAHGERLHAFRALDMSLRAQRPPERDSASGPYTDSSRL